MSSGICQYEAQNDLIDGPSTMPFMNGAINRMSYTSIIANNFYCMFGNSYVVPHDFILMSNMPQSLCYIYQTKYMAGIHFWDSILIS